MTETIRCIKEHFRFTSNIKSNQLIEPRSSFRSETFQSKGEGASLKRNSEFSYRNKWDSKVFGQLLMPFSPSINVFSTANHSIPLFSATVFREAVALCNSFTIKNIPNYPVSGQFFYPANKPAPLRQPQSQWAATSLQWSSDNWQRSDPLFVAYICARRFDAERLAAALIRIWNR